MSAPHDPGSTDGESVEHDGRMWRWSTRRDAWLPGDPELFEAVRGRSGTTWIYIPGDGERGEWMDILDFPDVGSTDPGLIVRRLVRGDE